MSVTVDLQDMSKMVLRINGPPELPEGYKLSMHISKTASESVRVFRPRTSKGGEPEKWSELKRTQKTTKLNQWNCPE